MNEVRAARIRLRSLGAGDAAFVCRLMNEPAWLEFIGDRAVRDAPGARRYIEDGPWSAYRAQGYGLKVVELLATFEPVGLCGLLKRDSLADPDLGFALLAAFHGQGYALEAARATLDHGRQALGLSRVVAIVDEGNVRSTRLLGKLGFEFERRVRLVADGAPVALYGRAL